MKRSCCIVPITARSLLPFVGRAQVGGQSRELNVSQRLASPNLRNGSEGHSSTSARNARWGYRQQIRHHSITPSTSSRKVEARACVTHDLRIQIIHTCVAIVASMSAKAGVATRSSADELSTSVLVTASCRTTSNRRVHSEPKYSLVA